MRWLPLVLLCGCNDGALPSSDGGDFCSGPTHIEVNGHLSASPAVSVMPLFLDCCEAQIVTFTSQQLSNQISLEWRVQVGAQPGVPGTVDLAQRPSGWGVSIASDCAPQTGSCSDSLSQNLSGTLTIAGDFQSGFSASGCITATEEMAHPILHTIRLWMP